MLAFRRFIAFLISVFLIISLTILAFSISSDLIIKNKLKIESWVNKQQIYSYLTSKVSASADQTVGSLTGVNGLNAYVLSNIKTVYPYSKFVSDFNSVFDSNYAWIQGKTAKPNYMLNLLSIKQDLANKVASYTLNSTQKLPICSDLQLIELQSNGPVSVNCLPPTVDPKLLSNDLKDKILNSNIFSNYNFITADSIKATKNGSKQPYYLTYKYIPQDYKNLSKALYISFTATLISILLILIIHPFKRRAIKLIAWSFLISGLVVLFSYISVDTVQTKLVNKVNNSASLSTYSVPINSFVSHAIKTLENTNKYFGESYIFLALVLFISAFIYKKRKQKELANST